MTKEEILRNVANGHMSIELASQLLELKPSTTVSRNSYETPILAQIVPTSEVRRSQWSARPHVVILTATAIIAVFWLVTAIMRPGLLTGFLYWFFDSLFRS